MKVCVRLLTAVLAIGAGFSAYAQAPAPRLVANWDIAILLDESGSIGASAWDAERNFARDLVNSFEFGPSLAAASVGAYGTTARSFIDMNTQLTGIIQAINLANAPLGGNTCHTCAFELASAQFAQFGRAASPNVTVFLTDGIGNVRTSESAAALAQLQATSTVFAIGVGSAVSPSVIDLIASDLPGIQTSFFLNDFNLANLSGALIEQFALYQLSLQTPSPGSVPEPATFTLLLAALALLALVRRRRLVPAHERHRPARHQS